MKQTQIAEPKAEKPSMTIELCNPDPERAEFSRVTIPLPTHIYNALKYLAYRHPGLSAGAFISNLVYTGMNKEARGYVERLKHDQRKAANPTEKQAYQKEIDYWEIYARFAEWNESDQEEDIEEANE